MTSKARASLGFGADDDEPAKPLDALNAFDPASYQAPAPRPPRERPDKATVREAGKAAGFVSREGDKPAPAAPAAPRLRRNHSGRSEQVNIKATPEFKARFQALARENDWTDAVTFEKMIGLMEKEAKTGL